MAWFALATLGAYPLPAESQPCDVDLLSVTARLDSEYHVYFGTLEASFADAPDLAVCIAERDPTAAAGAQPTLVAYADGNSEGACLTPAGESHCGGRGCSALALLVESMDAIVLHGHEPSAVCRDDMGMLGAVGAEYELGAPYDTATLDVYEGAGDRSAGIEGLTGTCTISSNYGDVRYGQGYINISGYFTPTSDFYVCSQSSRLCRFTESYLDYATEYILIDDVSADGQSIELASTVLWSYCGTNYAVAGWYGGWDGYVSIYGGDGNDTIKGGPHGDYLDGGDDTDSIWGQGGDDTIWGGSGVDYLHGGDGDDDLYGAGDADYLWGDGGDDTLIGGTGSPDGCYGGTEVTGDACNCEHEDAECES